MLAALRVSAEEADVADWRAASLDEDLVKTLVDSDAVSVLSEGSAAGCVDSLVAIDRRGVFYALWEKPPFKPKASCIPYDSKKT